MSIKGLKRVGLFGALFAMFFVGCASVQMETSNLVYRAKNVISEGDLRASIPILKKALVLSPKDVEANVSMAQVQYRLGNFQNAKVYAQTALSADPHDFRAMGILGLVDLREGAYERGMERVSGAMDIYNRIEEVGGNLPVEPKTILKQMKYELEQKKEISKDRIDKLADAFWAKIDWYEFDEEYRKWHYKSFYDIRPDGGATTP